MTAAKKSLTERPEWIVILFVLVVIGLPFLLWVGEFDPTSITRPEAGASKSPLSITETEYNTDTREDDRTLLDALKNILTALNLGVWEEDATKETKKNHGFKGVTESHIFLKYLESVAGAMSREDFDRKLKEEAAEEAPLKRAEMKPDQETKAEEQKKDSLPSSYLLQAMPVEVAPLHWYFVYENTEELKKLEAALKTRGIVANRLTPHLITFEANGKQLKSLREEIYNFSKRANPLKNYSIGKATYANQKTFVSIFLEPEKGGPYRALNWRLRFRLNTYDEFLDVVSRLGLPVKFERHDLVVLEVAPQKLDEFKTRIQEISGASLDTDASHYRLAQPNVETILLSIFITAKQDSAS